MYVKNGNRYLEVRRARVLAEDVVELVVYESEVLTLEGGEAKAVRRQLEELTIADITPEAPPPEPAEEPPAGEAPKGKKGRGGKKADKKAEQPAGDEPAGGSEEQPPTE